MEDQAQTEPQQQAEQQQQAEHQQEVEQQQEAEQRPNTEGQAGTRAVGDESGSGARNNRRKVREGLVVSTSMQNTVVVAAVERVRHPRYA
jgi:hypothetical protein